MTNQVLLTFSIMFSIEKIALLEEKEYDLNPTDDGEASEESHGAPNETQLGLCLDLLVSLNVVKRGCVKVDLNKSKG